MMLLTPVIFAYSTARADMPVEEAQRKAATVEATMTDAERFQLIFCVMGSNPIIGARDPRIPEGIPMSAGFTQGVPRLGIPNLLMTDASAGITNPGYRPGDTATAYPSWISLGSTFNPELAHRAGVAIGRESRYRGFNVLLAGGMNLMRDVRNGRNFEYLSEDPYLTAAMVAENVKGIQSCNVVSTLKHYSLNVNETNRHWLDAIIDPAAHRETDLLAFQIAIERSNPGSVMGAYNKVNGVYAGNDPYLLTDVLRRDWKYTGWVMSDWGATMGWEYANAGLDQECGVQIDRVMWGDEFFIDPLKKAMAEGKFKHERLSQMVQRILTAIYTHGLDTWGETPEKAYEPDMPANNEIAKEIALEGSVLLKNDGVLPIPTDRPLNIVVIGGHSQLGVISGTGSSGVVPPGGYAGTLPIGGPGIMGAARNLFIHPGAPLTALQRALPKAKFIYEPGLDPVESAAYAKTADLVIVFGIRVEGEGFDLHTLDLPWGQDRLIQTVARANPNTIVVLQTGNPVSMPWQRDVRAILQAWYPGQAGGEAIADLLCGVVSPSGKTAITWPVSLDQTPRPTLAGLGTPWGTPTTVAYNEEAELGYRWYAKTNRRPKFAFGYGLSYTTFGYDNLKVNGGRTISGSVDVKNTGNRPAAEVVQFYGQLKTGEPRQRLLGFGRVFLQPGETKTVRFEADPRLLSKYDEAKRQWFTLRGPYLVSASRSSVDPILSQSVEIDQRTYGD